MLSKYWLEKQSTETLSAIAAICYGMAGGGTKVGIPFKPETEVKLVAAGFTCETNIKSDSTYVTTVTLK